ncbi:MAG: V-type ATPase 116kDa subunit family protein, partial [Thermoplasmata archaeon]
MLTPEKMVEVVLLGPNEKMGEYIDELYELGVLHVQEPRAHGEILGQGKPAPDAERHSSLLLKLRIIQERVRLEGEKPKTRKTEAEIKKELESRIEDIIHGSGVSLLESTDRKQKMELEIKRLGEERRALEKLATLGLELGDLLPYETLGVATGFYEEDVVELCREKRLRAKIYANRKERVCAIIYPKEDEEAIKDFLARVHFREINLGEILTHAKGFGRSFHTFKELLLAYEEKITRLNKELEKINKDIHDALKKHRETLLATEEYLTIKVAKEELPQRMLVGETSFVLLGWVPAVDLPRLRKVSEKHDVSVIVVESDAEKPTKLANPGMTKNFEVLTRMYSLPRSEEIDPTAVLWITFPLFFALIISDIGYGIMLCFLALYLRNHRILGIGGRQVGNVLLYAGLVTTIFGFIFAELFGIPFTPHGEGYISLSQLLGIEIGYSGILNKFEDIGFLINITIVIGYLHLLLAFGLGIYLEYQHHNYRHIVGKIGWIVVLTAFFIGLMRVFAKIPLPCSTYALLIPLFIVGGILLAAGEGLITVVEILSIFSNLLSYIRLFAVGLAKAGMAVALNAILLPSLGTPYAIGIIGAFFLLHFLLLLLGVLSAGLHSIRLHYVEFFTKFYEGGGFPYAPFGYRR